MAFIFIIFGCWLIYLSVDSMLIRKRMLKLAEASVEWPSVPGRVVSASLSEGSRFDSKTRQKVFLFYPHVKYSYEVKGTTYESERLVFEHLFLSYSRDWANEYMERHAVGNEVTVYYDPQKPGEAVLDRDPKWAREGKGGDIGFTLMGLGCIGLGIWAFFAKR